MEVLLIPEKRAKLLLAELESVRKKLKCKIELDNENEVRIEGDPYDEYTARNVIEAFGRGFDFSDAYKLLSDDYFFKYISLKEMFKSKEQAKRIKARIIGTEGKAKEYMQEVSGARIAVYGSTVGIIGRIDEVEIATSALQVLLEGGTHKKAYRIMESTRRKKSEE